MMPGIALSRLPLPGLLSAIAIMVGACQSTPGEDSAAITDTLRQSAVSAEQGSDYKSAAEHYQKLLKRDPDNQETLISFARNLRYSGEANSAVKVLERLGPTSARPLSFSLELAKSKIAAGKAQSAIRVLTDAVGVFPNDWEVHSTLGIALDLERRHDEAMLHYEKAYALSEDNAAVLNNMALSAALSGNINKAISLLQNAPRLARHNPQLRQNLAFFYAIKGDMETARTLSEMDLDEQDVQANMAIYSRFRRGQKP